MVTGVIYYLLVAFINLGLDTAEWRQGYVVILFEMALMIAYVYLLFRGFDSVAARFERRAGRNRQSLWHFIRELLAISLFSSTLITLVVFIPQVLFFRYIPHPDSLISQPADVFLRIRLSYVINLVVAALFYTIRAELQLSHQLHDTELENEKLEKDTYKAQLELFRNQVNPHFLFNNLNTLASLIYKDQALASQFLTQLSALFRSILDYRDKELIELGAEMNWVNSYVFLLKMRFRDNIRFVLDIPEECRPYHLPPLTTQTLIEDAIKYNIVSSEQPLTIRMSIDEHNRLVFSNNLQLRNQVLSCADCDNGLGNIRRRFEFFTHELVDVEQTRSEFIVRLPLIK